MTFLDTLWEVLTSIAFFWRALAPQILGSFQNAYLETLRWSCEIGNHKNSSFVWTICQLWKISTYELNCCSVSVDLKLHAICLVTYHRAMSTNQPDLHFLDFEQRVILVVNLDQEVVKISNSRRKPCQSDWVLIHKIDIELLYWIRN